jgi:hypothetical protein
MVTEKSQLISLQQFFDDLIRGGFSKRNAEAVIQCVYPMSTNLLEIRKKGKTLDRRFILRKDAELVANSAKRIGAENLWHFLHQAHYSLSFKQFLSQNNNSTIEAARKNTRFLLNNFIEAMEKISKIKVGEFALMPSYSLDRDWMGVPKSTLTFSVELNKAGKEIAVLNFNTAIFKNKPALILGGFQGFSYEEIKEFEQALLSSGIVKEKTPAFKFMLSKLVNAAPLKIPILQKNPRNLLFNHPQTASIKSKMEEQGKSATDKEIEMQEKQIRGQTLGMHKAAIKSVLGIKGVWAKQHKTTPFFVVSLAQRKKLRRVA